ncbi:MAG: tetratricopeptide repeat protein [Elusimicrobiota bacterium]|nr:tetratricopeptide repeat protein [Elusimicrobiota bacterium]
MNKIISLLTIIFVFFAFSQISAAAVLPEMSDEQISSSIDAVFAQKRNKDNIKKIEDFAESLFQNKKYDYSRRIYIDLLKESPSKKKTFLYNVKLGDICVEEKNYVQGLLYYEEAQSLYDDNLALYLKIGSVLFGNGLYTHARSVFLNALKIDKKSNEAREKLGEISFILEEYVDSIRYYESIDSKNYNENMAMNMVHSYQRLNQKQKAADFGKTYLLIYDDFAAYFTMGKLYFDNKDYKEAKKYLIESIKKDNRNFSAYLYLAYIALNHENNIDEAEFFLGKASDIDSSYSSLDIMYSMLYNKAGDIKSAKKYAQSANQKAKTAFTKQESQNLLDYLNSKTDSPIRK